MMPLCSHTGTPRHFHSSTMSGSACLIRARSRASSAPRQSPSSLILPSMSWLGVFMPAILPRDPGGLPRGDVEAIEEIGGADPQHEPGERALIEVLLRLVPD